MNNLRERVEGSMRILSPLDPLPRRDIRIALRASVQLDQKDVAEICGVRPLTVFRWEREGRKPWKAHRDAYGRLLASCWHHSPLNGWWEDYPWGRGHLVTRSRAFHGSADVWDFEAYPDAYDEDEACPESIEELAERELRQ